MTLPNFSSEAFRIMMNIVYLEGVICGLKKSKEAHKGTDVYYKYDVSIFREEKRLTDITGNLNPSDFITKILT